MGYQLWDPEHRQIIRSSDVVFNESIMNQSIDKPIEVRRVTFSHVPTLQDGPTHKTRSASQVIEPSNTNLETSDSVQPNDSALNHPTTTPYATSQVIPRRSKRLSQPPKRYSPGIFFTDARETTSYKEASASADVATWHLAMESEMNSIYTNKT